jgi:hypothetical protein
MSPDMIRLARKTIAHRRVKAYFVVAYEKLEQRFADCFILRLA